MWSKFMIRPSLYIIAIIVAAYYIRKYSKKAEADITDFYKNKNDGSASDKESDSQE